MTHFKNTTNMPPKKRGKSQPRKTVQKGESDSERSDKLDSSSESSGESKISEYAEKGGEDAKGSDDEGGEGAEGPDAKDNDTIVDIHKDNPTYRKEEQIKVLVGYRDGLVHHYEHQKKAIRELKKEISVQKKEIHHLRGSMNNNIK